MRKTLILLTALTLIGCGTIKKDKQTEESTSKSDLNASKIDYKRFRDSSFILRPFDASRPMLIGKDTIVNVMIENHYRDRVQVIKDTIHKVDVVEVEKSRKTKETDNSKVYLYLFGFGFGLFALIILIVLWWLSRRLPKI